MNTRVKYLLENISQTNIKDKELIENEINKTPFFHPFRFLLLKTIEDKKSKAYKNALALASLYAPNREVLLDFIHESYPCVKTDNTPLNFSTDSVKISNEIDNETVTSKNVKLTKVDYKTIVNKKKKEKKKVYNFIEWLEVKKSKPKIKDSNLFSKGKLKEIDDYLNAIKLSNKNALAPETSKSFATETLANLYKEQKNYQKAIATYQELMLNYPEKSSLFASKINDIKKLSDDANL